MIIPAGGRERDNGMLEEARLVVEAQEINKGKEAETDPKKRIPPFLSLCPPLPLFGNFHCVKRYGSKNRPEISPHTPRASSVERTGARSSQQGLGKVGWWTCRHQRGTG